MGIMDSINRKWYIESKVSGWEEVRTVEQSSIVLYA